jgi:carboxyl-terminal processing protease
MKDETKPVVDWGRWPRPSLLLAFGLVLGLGAGKALDLAGSISSDSASGFRVVTEAWNTIQRHYVDRAALQGKNLAYGAIGGMMDSLGDVGHSTFLSPTLVKRVQEAQQGRLQGIGVEIQMKDGKATVVAPIDDSPALRAGLRPGDVIVKVEGKDITGLPAYQVVSRISGTPGTPVSLTILDPRSGRKREVTIVRASLKLKSVTWQRLPGTSVAQLRIANFDEGTAKELRKALEEIEHDDNEISGIILDLRNNPGGILDAAVDAASQFLKGGNVLLVKNARGRVKPVPVLKGGLAQDFPLAVLINGGSASGAEIVAGALEDAHRATLVGEKTFGTGTVLQEFPLADGSALLLAVQEWLTPDGQSFWHKGIAPDVAVELPKETEMLLPEEERTMTSSQLRASGDIQLLRALELVRKSASDRSTLVRPLVEAPF